MGKFSLCVFVVKLLSRDLEADLRMIENTMDFSNLHPDHVLHSTENESALFKMKLETSAHPILAFCGLGAKSYSVLVGLNSLLTAVLANIDIVNT